MSRALLAIVCLTVFGLAACASTSDAGPEYLGGFARAFAWSPDGDFLVAASRTDLRVFDGRELALQRTIPTLNSAARYRIHQSPASVAFSRDGGTLATAAFDSGITLWDAHSWQRKVQIPASEMVTSLAFAGDGNELVGVGPKGPLALWDARTGEKLWTALEAPSGVLSIAASTDGKWLAAGTQDGRIVLWDLTARKILAQSQVQPGRVLSVAFSPDASRLASSAECVDVRIWETQHGLQAQHLIDSSKPTPEQSQGRAILGLAALVSNVASFRTIHAPSGAMPPSSNSAPTQFDCQISFSPNGRLLGTVHHSEELSASYHTEIYDVETGKLLARLHGTMSGVAFSPDNSMAVTSGVLHLVVFDPLTGSEKAAIR